MSIVHQGNRPPAAAIAAAQRCDCDATDLPSSADIERMLRADGTRFAYFSVVVAGLASSWRECAR